MEILNFSTKFELDRYTNNVDLVLDRKKKSGNAHTHTHNHKNIYTHTNTHKHREKRTLILSS